MAVITDKSPYGIDTDLCYSYPVNVDKNGEWHIVEGLELNNFQKKMITSSEAELKEERMMALKR